MVNLHESLEVNGETAGALLSAALRALHFHQVILHDRSEILIVLSFDFSSLLLVNLQEINSLFIL